jgi:glucosylceramidase
VSWVVSTEKSFFQPSLAKVDWHSGMDDPDLIVLENQPQQVIQGFGGCFNELGWDALQIIPEAERTQILKDFFDAEQGFRFNICRMPMGANDYSRDWYSYNETNGDFQMDNFSIDRDLTSLVPYIKAAKKINPQLKVWASPWCPPSWMKTNQHYACRMDKVNDLCCPEKEGREGVTQFRMEDDYLRAYSLYFQKFLDAYQKQGITIYAVHVQNEPNSCQNFPSCVWKASDLNVLIGKYLGPTLAESHPEVEIWYGTIERPFLENIDTVLMDQESRRYVDGLGFQWAGKKAIPAAHEKYPEILKMQTETECGDGSNNWAAAEYTFNLMQHYFNNGANAYMYWNLVLDETGKSQWGWKQNSMISINRQTRQITRNPEFYLIRHFSQFVEPGAVKLNLSGTSDQVLAFKNPDGRLVLIMGNNTLEPVEKVVMIGKDQFKLKLEPKSFNTLKI